MISSAFSAVPPPVPTLSVQLCGGADARKTISIPIRRDEPPRDKKGDSCCAIACHADRSRKRSLPEA